MKKRKEEEEKKKKTANIQHTYSTMTALSRKVLDKTEVALFLSTFEPI